MTDPTIRERLRELADTFEGLAAGYGYAVGQTNGLTASAWSLARSQIKTLGTELDTLERRAEAAEDLYKIAVSEHGHDETHSADWPSCLPVHIAMNRYRAALATPAGRSWGVSRDGR